MDFSNPAALISGTIIGLIGMAVFMYGKKQGHVPALLAGVVLSAEGFVIQSTLIMWIVAVLCLAGLYAMSERSGTSY